jgi:hypothetical protein
MRLSSLALTLSADVKNALRPSLYHAVLTRDSDSALDVCTYASTATVTCASTFPPSPSSALGVNVKQLQGEFLVVFQDPVLELTNLRSRVYGCPCPLPAREWLYSWHANSPRSTEAFNQNPVLCNKPTTAQPASLLIYKAQHPACSFCF